MLFIIKRIIGLALRPTELYLSPFLQSNISILTAGNPVRSDNAWNEYHSENVYAQWRIVKLQTWDSVSSIYCLRYTAVVFSLALSSVVDAIAEAIFAVWYFVRPPFGVFCQTKYEALMCAVFLFHLVKALSHLFLHTCTIRWLRV